MKIKNASELLASATFTPINNTTKLSLHQTLPSSPPQQQQKKPQRQTAAQRRAALLAQKTIIAPDESVKDTLTITTTTTTTETTSPITATTTESISPIITSITETTSSSTTTTNETVSCDKKIEQKEENAIPTPPISPSLDSCSVCTASLEANSRILSVKRDGNLKAVMMEFSTMKKQGLTLTHHTYNLVLDAHATLRREGSPLAPMLRVYDEMVRSRIQPSSYTYTLLLRTLCRRDVEVQKTVAMLKRQSARTGQLVQDIDILEAEANLDKAMDLFGKATAAQHTQVFEVDLFNQLLRVLSHYGDTVHALEVFTQLEQSTNASPNAATFAALINLFGRAGDIQAARRYFAMYQELKHDMGVHDSSYVYNALVDSHLKCGLLEGAIRVIEKDMIQDAVKLTIIPYNSVIRHYCTQGEMEKAHGVVNQLLRDPEHLPQPDASTYGPILAAYCHAHDLQGATDVYADLIKTDIAKSYGNLANYALLCLSKNQGEKALQVVEDMRVARLEPDPVLACRIISYFIHSDAVDQSISALHTILGVLSPRTLAKGQRLLIDTSLQLVSTVKDVHQALRVAQVTSCLWFGGKLPVPLSKTLVRLYQDMGASSSFTLSDYTILFDAVIILATVHHHNSNQVEIKGVDEPMSLFLSLLKGMQSDHLFPSSNLVSRVAAFWQMKGDVTAEATWRSAVDPVCSSSSDDQSTDVKSTTSATTTTTTTATTTTETNSAENDSSTVLTQEDATVSIDLFDVTTSQDIMKSVMHGHINNAMSSLNSIMASDKLPSPDSLRDAIALVGKQGHMDMALKMYQICLEAYETIEQDQGYDKSQAIYLITNSILIGYAQQGDMANAKVYYDQIKKMGLFPDGNGYASLLLGSAKCATDEASDALTIYDEAKRHNVKPTTFFYNVVISKLAKARKLESALYLFEEMREFKVTPNSITYGAIISACVRAGSETHARRLFGEMLSSPSYQPRVGPFNNMMQFYVRQQPNRERVLEYFAELRRRHIKPSPHTYKLLMEAYASMTPYDMPTAHRMLSEMERRDRIRPQATHYATLIYAYGTLQRDVQSADRVFGEMVKSQVPPDEAVYQAMLDTLISNDHLERAEVMYQEMLDTIDKSSSPYIENLFIRGYGQKGLLDKAESVFNKMTDDKSMTSLDMYDSGDNNEDVSNTIVVREPSTYEAMVRAYLDNKLVDKAKLILDQMVQRDFPGKVLAVVADLVLE
ncbi:uncharacterized protein BX664DRAFT_201790 [Halteromyces radiatus]|uniref:uncharacterized protein n=1 Tax=Halteromyces radiatus TaxID=101107 RepID=UPI00221EC8B5|nr:uncharacterized protein BX664DRAFT_201790 [Halteromyces radiatus]KAI8079743.1 hypothetical protein BX664DRAFT_201790 [Halteromyces radiatus]